MGSGGRITRAPRLKRRYRGSRKLVPPRRLSDVGRPSESSAAVKRARARIIRQVSESRIADPLETRIVQRSTRPSGPIPTSP